jgi:hypothetical protein
MEEHDVRAGAEALCAALVAGDIEAATADFSPELRQNLGEVLALLPLPLDEAMIDSLGHGGGSGYTVVLRLVGSVDEVLIETRWKERDGRPIVVEASHLSVASNPTETGEIEVEDQRATGT